MKTKNLFATLLLCLSVLCLTACNSNNEDENDHLIWDFTPIILGISVQDAAGNDLLNPDTEGSIAYQGIKAIYKGEVYEKDDDTVETRAYSAHFKGLQTIVNNKGIYYLTFGEFNGDDTFVDELVSIDWNDNTIDTLSFSSKLSWKSQKEPVIDREFFLNGEKQESPIFTIIK